MKGTQKIRDILVGIEKIYFSLKYYTNIKKKIKNKKASFFFRTDFKIF